MKMKTIKKEKSFTKDFGPLVLWREDLNDLLLAVASEKIEISTEDYSFESLDEVEEHFGQRPINTLKIASVKPHMSVTFGRMGSTCWVYASPTAAQLFLAIEGILERCERRPRKFYGTWISPIAFLPLAMTFIWDPKIGVFPVMLVPSLLIFSWVLRVGYINLRWHSVLHMQRRYETPSFFQRNKDQMWMLVISAIVGGLLTFAGTQLKEKFYPSVTEKQP
jgi:hypothetical protein